MEGRKEERMFEKVTIQPNVIEGSCEVVWGSLKFVWGLLKVVWGSLKFVWVFIQV